MNGRVICNDATYLLVEVTSGPTVDTMLLLIREIGCFAVVTLCSTELRVTVYFSQL